MPKKRVFNPEGKGYDYESARAAGMQPKKGHWASRVSKGPKEGLILKGRGHKTFHKTVGGETRAGYKIYKRAGRYWSSRRGARKNP